VRIYTPFTRYNGCQTGCTTGMSTGLTTVLNEQPLFVQPAWQPVWQPLYTRYIRLLNGLSNGLKNRLNVCIHDTTACQTLWQPVWQQIVSCKRGFRVQVWNVLHAARWKCRTQKIAKKIANCAPSHNCVGPRHILTIGKNVSNSKIPELFTEWFTELFHLFLQYGELRPTSGWDRFVRLGHPS